MTLVLAKIICFILAMALVSAAVLVARQLRTQALSEAAATRLRIIEADAALWRLRAEIAQRIGPQAISDLAEGAGVDRPAAPAGGAEPRL
ncbi:MAG: hypothetical protein ACF8R7_07305 [Phycisphaerales bacterium JB039]